MKDTRLKAKQAGRELGQLFERAMTGETGPGAEGAGLRVVGLLIQEAMIGRSPLANALRDFLQAIQNKADPLRRDIPPELWAAVWPTLNMLSHAIERSRTHGEGREGHEGGSEG